MSATFDSELCEKEDKEALMKGDGKYGLKLAEEEVKRFLRLNVRTPFWVARKAAVAVAFCGQLKCTQLRELTFGDLTIHEAGIDIGVRENPVSNTVRVFQVPFDDYDVFACMATKIRKLIVQSQCARRPFHSGDPVFRANNERRFFRGQMTHSQMKAVPENVARLLGLEHPERYLDYALVYHLERLDDEEHAHLETSYQGSEDGDSEFDLDQLEQTLERQMSKSASKTEQTNLRVWLEFMKFARTQTPLEDHYAKYFTYLKEVKKFKPNSIATRYAHLNNMHKRQCGTRLQSWPKLMNLIKSYYTLDGDRGPIEKNKRLTEDRLMEFLRMSVEKDLSLIQAQAVAALVYHCPYKSESVRLLEFKDIVRHESVGYEVHMSGAGSYRVPYNHDDPHTPCLASCIDRYGDLVRLHLKGDQEGQYLKVIHKDAFDSRPLGRNLFFKLTELAAQALGLPHSELYGGKCFPQKQKPKGRSKYSAAAECSEMRQMVKEVDLRRFPVANVQAHNSGTGERYKLEWQLFISFAQTNQPVERDYYDFFKYLRSKKGITAQTLSVRRSMLNYYHKQIFGGSMKDFKSVTDLLKVWSQEDQDKGALGLKKFAPGELETFFSLHFATPYWVVRKAAISFIICGKMSPTELAELQVSDVMGSQEGYWVTFSPENGDPSERKTFLIPLDKANPVMCLASRVKDYMDAVTINRDYIDGQFFKSPNSDNGFLSNPLGKTTLGSIGSAVAKALNLNHAKSYRNISFLPNEMPKRIVKPPQKNTSIEHQPGTSSETLAHWQHQRQECSSD